MIPAPEATPLTDALIAELSSGTAQQVLARNWVTPLTDHARSLERRLSRVARVLEEAGEYVRSVSVLAMMMQGNNAHETDLLARIDAELAALEGKHGTE